MNELSIFVLLLLSLFLFLALVGSYDYIANPTRLLGGDDYSPDSIRRRTERLLHDDTLDRFIVTLELEKQVDPDEVIIRVFGLLKQAYDEEILEVPGTTLCLQDSEGRIIGKTDIPAKHLERGY